MDLVINRYRSGVKTYNKTSLADASGFSALRKIVFMLWWPLRAATKFTIDSLPLYHAIFRHGVLCCWYSCWLSISKHHIENPTQCCNFFFWPYATAKSHCWQCFPKQHPRRLCREESRASTSPCRSTCKGASMIRLNKKENSPKSSNLWVAL